MLFNPCYLYQISRESATLDEGYIGITTNLTERWNRHKRDAAKGIHHNPHLQRAIQKYSDITYKVIAIGKVDYILDIEEQLRPYKYKGYNIAVGGNRVSNNKGVPMSSEQKVKISKAHSKSVLQIDKDTGDVIAMFPSTRAVHDSLGYSQGNVSAVCRGDRLSANGYLWEYADGRS